MEHDPRPRPWRQIRRRVSEDGFQRRARRRRTGDGDHGTEQAENFGHEEEQDPDNHEVQDEGGVPEEGFEADEEGDPEEDEGPDETYVDRIERRRRVEGR